MQNNFLSLTSSSPLGRLGGASKHLPDIPSTEEMEASGVNLAEMNKLLLQKVEELTLYQIDKDKEINELQESKKEIQDGYVELENRLEKMENIINTLMKN